MSEEKRDLVEGESGEVYPAWERGYRGWRIGFKDVDRSAGKLQLISREPRLRALVVDSDWEPGEEGEVISDWRESEGKLFERTEKGFYSLRDVDEAVKEYPRAHVYGAIIPYGKTFYGMRGYRSEKATVDALFRKDLECFVCGKPAKFMIHNEEIYAVCGRCLSRMKNILTKGGYVGEEMEDVLRRLAGIYEAELVDLPERCRK